MYLPKKEIYNLLSQLNCGVSQTEPEVFNELPYVNFSVIDNNVKLFLDNTIAYQEVDAQIDIWANTSVEASDLLSQIEEIMRENFYIMTFSSDIPHPGNIFHIVTRFSKKK